jgi:hypothetical protein
VEAAEQQRMSADTVSQWSRACINADAIVGAARGPEASMPTYDLGTRIPSETLREAYAGYCKQHSLRAASETVLHQAFVEMFGPRRRTPSQPGSTRRPWGYAVPTGNRWQAKVDKRLGIK